MEVAQSKMVKLKLKKDWKKMMRGKKLRALAIVSFYLKKILILILR